MANLVFRNGPYAGKSLQIPPGKVIVAGRNRNIELPLPDLKLSRKHCHFSSVDGGYVVQDLGSTNGTYVNGKRLEGGDAVKLGHFDRVVIGDTEMEFQCPENLEEEQTRVGMPAPESLPVGDTAPAIQLPSGNIGIEEVKPPVELSPPESFAPPVEMPEPVAIPSVVPAHEVANSDMEKDPLQLALDELDKPLPPDPDPEQDDMEPLEDRPQLLFCDYCDGSIAVLDLDLGEAKELGGKLICKDCMEKGVTVGPDPQDADGEGDQGQNLDEILKGLGRVEEVALDESGEVPAHLQESDLMSADDDFLEEINTSSTKRMTETGPGRPKGPPPPPVRQKEVDDLLNDDFEEIGQGALGSEPNGAQGQSVKSPNNPSPFLNDDQDLLEIGDTGHSG